MPTKMLMDIHPVDPPPTKTTSQWVEVAVKKEAISPEEERPSIVVLTIEPMDTPLSNPPPSKPVAISFEVVVKQEMIEEVSNGGKPNSRSTRYSLG